MSEKIVGIYDVKVDAAIKNLNKLQKEVSDVDKSAAKSAKKTEDAYSGMAKNLSGQFKKVGAAIGLAFGAQQLISFGQEAVKVAAQAEGISKAFERLNRPNLLAELRKATRGTVDDLTLMRQAVRAENFQVPLEKLGKFFDFATQRSIQTGESVDYLVSSIIDGIGRKSTLVLDNLGISASELQDEIKKVGDFGEAAGNIIERELAKAGDVADTTAIKLARITTAFDNMKVSVGAALIEFADFSLILNDIARAANTSQEGVDNYAERAIEAGKAITELSLARNEEIGVVERYRILLFGLNEAQREEIKLSRESNEISQDEYVTLSQLNELYSKIDQKESDQIKNLAYYNELIKNLQEEQKAVNTTLERNFEINKELAVAMEERNRLLGKETEEQKKLREQLETIQKLREIEYEMLQSTGLPVVQALSDSLNGLNQLLKEQQDILNNAPEFSKQYKDASNAIDKLQKKIKEFNDSQIDESNKYDISATAMGLIPNPKNLKQQLDESLALFNEFSNAAQNIVGNIVQTQQNAFAQEQQILREQLEQGLITREEFEQKENEIRRKSAQTAKDTAIFQATISTAQAVVNALGSFPFSPLNIAIAAAVGAAGAAQIAAIASQPLPQFAEGGFVNEHGEIKGRKHVSGGVKLEAEGGEFITAAKYAQPNADILKAINSGQWEKYKVENIIAPAIEQVLEGGFDNIGASMILQGGFNDKNLLKGTDRLRSSNKEGFIYLGKKIESLKGKQSRWN